MPGQKRVTGTARQVIAPLSDLFRAPGGARDRQVLFGETLCVLEDRDGWSFVQADKDGYVGYVPSAALGPKQAATHWVTAPATHAYRDASIKSPDLLTLSFGCRITGIGETADFIETATGHIPKVHLHDIGHVMPDLAATAALFLGTPYLWGGNSRVGIDCSGLVQAALIAAGRSCPGDSDLQLAAFGPGLPDGTPVQRNDLLFWAGHVALVCDAAMLIHANAHHMATAFEPVGDTIARIAAQGNGLVTGHIRF